MYVAVRGRNYWIGAHKRFDNGGWCWGEEHTPITLFDWYPGQPDNGGGIERCIAMWPTSDHYQWHDAPCSDNSFSYYYIREMEVSTD